jgi:hypothetical protein
MSTVAGAGIVNGLVLRVPEPLIVIGSPAGLGGALAGSDGATIGGSDGAGLPGTHSAGLASADADMVGSALT